MCKFWIELDNEMGLFEFCRLVKKKCTCSGEPKQCSYPNTEVICPYCLRKVPNKNWFTKNGCIWCDDKKEKK